MNNYEKKISEYPASVVKMLIKYGTINNEDNLILIFRYSALHYRLWNGLYNYFKNVNKYIYLERKRVIKEDIYLKICAMNNLKPHVNHCFLCDYSYIMSNNFTEVKRCSFCPCYVKGMISCFDGLFSLWLVSDGDELLEITKEIRDIVLKGVD